MKTGAPINDPRSLFRPNLKAIHRGGPGVTLSAGAHTLLDSSLVPLRGWYPIEFLHFPIRSFAQSDRKYANLRAALGESRNSYYEEVRRAREEGRFHEFYESLIIGDDALDRGLRDGSLVVDARLRDALRSLHTSNGQEFALPVDGVGRLSFPRPTVVDDAAYALDVAALGEADVVRLQRRLDALLGDESRWVDEHRLQALERGLVPRLFSTLSGAARGMLRRVRKDSA